MTDFIVPQDRYHDGWDGAAGAEIHDLYEPYPWLWDYSLMWCWVMSAWKTKEYDRLNREPDIEQIPTWLFRRAIRCGIGQEGEDIE